MTAPALVTHLMSDDLLAACGPTTGSLSLTPVRANVTCPACLALPEPVVGPGDAAVEQAAAELAAERQPEMVSCAPATAPEQPRTYVVGLPVVISVHPDGTVTAEVDLSEAADLWDGIPTEGDGTPEVPLRPLYGDDEVAADTQAVTLAVDEGRVGLVPPPGSYLPDEGKIAAAVVLTLTPGSRSGDELSERDVVDGLRARLDEFYPWDDGYPALPSVESVTVVL